MTDDLIERALRGEASEAELAELAAWRRASPENAQHYLRAERLISAVRTLRTEPTVPRPSAESIIAASAAGRGAGLPDRRSNREGVARPDVDARPGRQSTPSASHRGQVRSGAPAAARPQYGSRSAVGARRRLYRTAPWAVAAAAVLVAIVNLGDRGGPAAGAPAEVLTGATELATVKLGDGTVVRLAPSSRLQLDGVGVRGDRGARQVTLDGRAFFVVAKQPAGRPFRVQTRAATANVLGTRFELVTEDAALRLHVIEGRVALEAAQNRVEVGAGEQSGVRDGIAAAPAPAVGAAVEPAWLGKFLVFQATPLDQAAREIERLYGVRVVLVDPGLATATVTATFTDRPVNDVVNVLCEVLSAQCVVEEGIARIGS